MTKPGAYMPTHTVTIAFGTRKEMQRAANKLMVCHSHHFKVLPDNGYALEMSPFAAQCVTQEKEKKK